MSGDLHLQAAGASAGAGDVTVLLLALALIVAVARVFGRLATWVGQPPVIGEIVAGVLLGPTLLGGTAAVIFPDGIRPLLSALADVGLMLFMFVIGLELNREVVRRTRSTAAGVAVACMAVPFVLGVLLARYLSGHHETGHALGFQLFLGAAMSITAFPVLARILADRGLQHTRVGSIALTSAAAGDAFAWVMLALVVWLSGADAGHPWRLALLVPYAVAMLFVVRPLLLRAFARREKAQQPAPRLPAPWLSLLLAGLLASAALTQWLGIHFIFGAFFFGALVPRGTGGWVREEVAARISPLNHALLLPIFFVVAGLQTDLSGLGLSGVRDFLLILLVAVGGKFLGVLAGTGGRRMPVAPTVALGALMNTRGLTELVILGVGVQAGLLGNDLYSLMVLMAVTTTLMAAPILRLCGFGLPRAGLGDVTGAVPRPAPAEGEEKARAPVAPPAGDLSETPRGAAPVSPDTPHLGDS
ncbi:cation:proton antiporter [Streptomyces sp. 021-4]|uniref:cation:proton antiporter n=1 Tax=Streptomyces sp. 021-4 TaxID=2789260 RepID=UPI0039F4F1DA